MNVCILGCGAYAIALALKFNKNNCNIKMWTKFEDERNFLLKNKYSKLLPDIYLPDNILITCDMKEAIEKSNIIVIALPIEVLEENIQILKNYFDKNMHICIATKGIENNNLLFPSQVVNKYINTNNISIISGPTFAIDLAQDKIAGLTLATSNADSRKIICSALKTNDLDITFSEDLIGIQILGTIKNILAIASGIIIGLDMSESTLATFLTKVLFDVKKIVISLGGKSSTIISYAGIGDLVLTCTNKKSRNFTLGYLIGSNNEEKENFIKKNTVEGLYSLNGFCKLLNKRNISIYLIELLYNIINNKSESKEILNYIISEENLLYYNKR